MEIAMEIAMKRIQQKTRDAWKHAGLERVWRWANQVWCDRQESNLYRELRRLVSYPLDDGRHIFLHFRSGEER